MRVAAAAAADYIYVSIAEIPNALLYIRRCMSVFVGGGSVR